MPLRWPESRQGDNGIWQIDRETEMLACCWGLQTGTATLGSSIEEPHFLKKDPKVPPLYPKEIKWISKRYLHPLQIATLSPNNENTGMAWVSTKWWMSDKRLMDYCLFIQVLPLWWNTITQSNMARKEFISASSSKSPGEVRAGANLTTHTHISWDRMVVTRRWGVGSGGRDGGGLIRGSCWTVRWLQVTTMPHAFTPLEEENLKGPTIKKWQTRRHKLTLI